MVKNGPFIACLAKYITYRKEIVDERKAYLSKWDQLRTISWYGVYSQPIPSEHGFKYYCFDKLEFKRLINIASYLLNG